MYLSGECYLTEWTVWSPCQLSCISGDDLGFGSVQVRSRAVLAQEPENLLQCPEQEWEARPCTGKPKLMHLGQAMQFHCKNEFPKL